MTTVAHLTNLNYVVLDFATQGVRATPEEIRQAAEGGDLLGRLEGVAENAGLDASVLGSWTPAERAAINDVFASWANVIDLEGKYGTTSDRADQGWIALAFGINDQIRAAS
jgi:hypothetical protein